MHVRTGKLGTAHFTQEVLLHYGTAIPQPLRTIQFERLAFMSKIPGSDYRGLEETSSKPMCDVPDSK
jgi:hypothetical protein